MMPIAVPLLVPGLVILVVIAGCDEPAATKASPAPAATATPAATVPTAPVANQPPLAEGNRPATIDTEDPQLCVGCHAAVVAEWNESMHAMADASKDPIYGAMRELRRKKQGEETAQKCLNCHGARSVLLQRPSLAVHGVSCATCHNVAAVDPSKGPGAKALALAGPGEMYGPHDIKPGFSPVHGTGNAPAHMKDGSTLCLACHNATKTPSGAAACTTGPEWRSAVGDSEGAPAATCVSCHMPVVKAPSGSVSKRQEHRSHRFLGPHRAWLQDDPVFLKSSVELEASWTGADVKVALEAGSGHAFPSGFPGRYAMLVVHPKDAAGKPLAALPPVMLNKVYVDAEGNRAPAAFAKELKSDTRLKAGETREVTVSGVPEGAASVDVKLLYGLLPPPLAKKLGLEASKEARPIVIASQTLTR